MALMCNTLSLNNENLHMQCYFKSNVIAWKDWWSNQTPNSCKINIYKHNWIKKLSILKIGISEITDNVMKLNTEILPYECIAFVTQGCIVTIIYKSVIINKEYRVYKIQVCLRHRVVDCRAHFASTFWYIGFEWYQPITYVDSSYDRDIE